MGDVKTPLELDLEAKIEILEARLQIAEASAREANARFYRASFVMDRVSQSINWDELRKSVESIRSIQA